MKILSNENDKRFRQRIRKEIGFHHSPDQGWEPLDMEDEFVISYTDDSYEDRFEDKIDIAEARSQDYKENFQKTLGLIEGREDSFYILAFENGQYVPEAKEKFKEEMNEKIVEVSFNEIEEIVQELIIVYILPKSLEWGILLDHDGNIHLSGEIKEKAEEIFGEEE